MFRARGWGGEAMRDTLGMGITLKMINEKLFVTYNIYIYIYLFFRPSNDYSPAFFYCSGDNKTKKQDYNPSPTWSDAVLDTLGVKINDLNFFLKQYIMRISIHFTVHKVSWFSPLMCQALLPKQVGALLLLFSFLFFTKNKTTEVEENLPYVKYYYLI